jgi:hypothetical protein
MSDPEALRLLSEIRDIQLVIAKRQKIIVVTNILLLVLGVVFCAAFLTEIVVVVSVFLKS